MGPTLSSYAAIVAAVLAGAGPGDISVEPAFVRLVGSDASAQLVVTVRDAQRRPVDATGQATYEVDEPAVAAAEPGGLIRVVGDGAATIRVTVGGLTARARVAVADRGNARPVHFATEVVPVLTRLGCNAGACHGKSGGRNGFSLSLLGFDPAADFRAVARAGRGRRVFPAAPAASLLLQKATAGLPHGGGKKTEVGSPEYRTLARWIAAGAPEKAGGGRVLERIEVAPARRVVAREGRQQLRVTAHYGDGTSADVTRLAQFKTNAGDLAGVDEVGLVRALRGVGEAAIMARFGGMVAVARATVPRGEPVAFDPPAARSLVDPIWLAKLRELGLAPSPDCTDAEFARRASLDICGVLPDPAEVSAFEADSDPNKRVAWVDRLLDRPEYADLFAMKWSAILRNKSTFGVRSRAGTFAFHAWIRQSLAENKPYDRFVAEIVAARGDVASNPPVAWYRQVNTTEVQADDVAQLFLGLRIQCARCHHHPFESWGQDDYYGFASIFARIGRKSGTDPFAQRIYTLPEGYAPRPGSGELMPPKPLGGPAWGKLGPSDDPRRALADWLGKPDNPFFARALVNRYWKHFLGRGLVEPEDDMRATNPPSNPELLDALADDFVRGGYDLRRLARTIATCRAYDRSSLPGLANEDDHQNYARFYPRRLPAEVLLDALNAVAGRPEAFADLPAEFRAVQLPDDSFNSAFLDVFGRPRRESVCECERTSEANLAQTLHLLNSGEVQAKLKSDGGRLAKLADDPRADAEKVEAIYRLCFSRAPTDDERSTCEAFLRRRRETGGARPGYEDLAWALVNTKEFLFVH